VYKGPPDGQVEYARSIASQLSGAGFRVEIDDSNERLQKKIRNQQLQKVPYMLVVGKTEVADGTVNVRARSGDQKTITAAEFVAKLSSEVASLK